MLQKNAGHGRGFQRAKAYRLARERIVGNCRSALVPIRIRTECPGGSSRVLSSALALSSFKKSASSMSATLRPPMNGRRAMSWHKPSRIRRASSPTKADSGMKLLSRGFSMINKSGCVREAVCTHESQRPQGASVSSSTCGQSSAWASRSANARLPMPGGPTNKNVLASRPRAGCGESAGPRRHALRYLASSCALSVEVAASHRAVAQVHNGHCIAASPPT